MFSIAYVAITVRARLAGFDLALEEAAAGSRRDAVGRPSEDHAFRSSMPGILAGALLAFALSIDDFVTSNFVAGHHGHVPALGLRRLKVGIPPQVFVLGTAIFATGVMVAALNLVSQGRKKRQEEAARKKAGEDAPRRTSWTSSRSSTSRCGEPNACEDLHKRPKVPSDLRKRL